MSRKFTPLTQKVVRNGIAYKLSGVADNIRDLRARLGGVSRAVYIVRVMWSGRARGEGAPVLVERFEILPVPVVKVSLDVEHADSGKVEDGTVQVRDISASYTLDKLTRGSDEESTPANVEVLYEVVDMVPGGSVERRRYTLVGVPTYTEAPPGWSLTLARAYDDMDIDGNPMDVS